MSGNENGSYLLVSQSDRLPLDSNHIAIRQRWKLDGISARRRAGLGHEIPIGRRQYDVGAVLFLQIGRPAVMVFAAMRHNNQFDVRRIQPKSFSPRKDNRLNIFAVARVE